MYESVSAAVSYFAKWNTAVSPSVIDLGANLATLSFKKSPANLPSAFFSIAIPVSAKEI